MITFGGTVLRDDEPYCVTCGAWAGMFIGMEGWHHFRGDPSPGGGAVALYDAGHQPVIGWRPAGPEQGRHNYDDLEVSR